MINEKEFKIKSRPDLKLRVGKISALDMLALNTHVDFNDMSIMKDVYEFILTHVEVELAGVWVTVKEKGKEIYMPENIESDLVALQEIVMYFLVNVLKPLFVKSKE